EDVDYCLKAGERGLRVICAGDAVLTHFESQSGVERFRQVSWNVARLADRWNGRVRYDAPDHTLARGSIRRTVRLRRGQSAQEELPVPRCTVVVHGMESPDAVFEKSLRANHAPIDRIVWTARTSAIPAARQEMEIRGDRYVAIVDAACELREGWLDELIRQIEFSPNTGAAAYAECGGGEDRPLFTASAGCVLIALSKFPQHERLRTMESLDGAVADFLIRGLAHRAGVRAAVKDLARIPAPGRDAAFSLAHGLELHEACAASREALERELAAPLRRQKGLVSIVMLSWNAPEYTKIALESIRKYTGGEHEVIIVDNGSGPETTEWLSTLAGVKVIFNPSNRGYAGGNNQAMAAAAGEYVVLLNNDVVVTEGWLEGLLSAFDRIPALGISAPRSNIIAGDQVVLDAAYQNLDQMHEYAARRRARYRRQGYMTDRAIGLCLCIDRRVIEEIGGIDERFGVGNFEDDDFCMRVRAAGYRIHVCDDVFIHHFGSKTFAANKIDWQATMRENWSKFAAKWELPPEQAGGGYQPQPVIRRGFVREKHFFALPRAAPEAALSQAPEGERSYQVIFAAVVRSERDWEDVGNFLRRYVRAFDAAQPVLLTIASLGGPPAADIGARASRAAAKEGLSEQAVADVLISDEADLAAWIDAFPAAARWRVNETGIERFDLIDPVTERSPSALRRVLKAVAR
ncbi:MAG TPA: glycosyltransferase, partial [Candidatus Baltobacteraceae bacterium]|nr:glycosyltransferase [Candidatus Baltobacteraceae bacterium]